MIRTILAFIGICTLAYWLLGAKEADCGENCYSIVCYAQTCTGNCTCMQPDGLGTKGWCN